MKTCLLLLAYIFVHVSSEDSINATCGNRCCSNYYKDNGSCVECPLGTHGLNCSGICVEFYYGRFCHNKCECPLKQCDIKYGCMTFETESTIKIPINGKSYIKEISSLNWWALKTA